jgi:hypothetical protein
MSDKTVLRCICGDMYTVDEGQAATLVPGRMRCPKCVEKERLSARPHVSPAKLEEFRRDVLEAKRLGRAAVYSELAVVEVLLDQRARLLDMLDKLIREDADLYDARKLKAEVEGR